MGKDPLEKEMAIDSSIIAWEIPWTRGAWWATVHGAARVGHSLATEQQSGIKCWVPKVVGSQRVKSLAFSLNAAGSHWMVDDGKTSVGRCL